MASAFGFFGPPVITVFLLAVGTVPYALWATRRKPSRPARWAVIGAAAAIAAYGAGTVYGLAYTHLLDLCADRTGDGVYRDSGRDSTLVSADRGSFPLSVDCHWSSGDSTEVVWFWVSPLLYAGVACCVGCLAWLLVDRHRREGGGVTSRRTPLPSPLPRRPTSRR